MWAHAGFRAPLARRPGALGGQFTNYGPGRILMNNNALLMPGLAASGCPVRGIGAAGVLCALGCSKNSRAGPGPVMVRNRQPGLPLR
jgi:hypothetical protein